MLNVHAKFHDLSWDFYFTRYHFCRYVNELTNNQQTRLVTIPPDRSNNNISYNYNYK